MEQARAFIAREFAPLIADLRRGGVMTGRDYKSALQELVQSRDQPPPDYRVAGTMGPDHQKLFRVEVVVQGEAQVATYLGPLVGPMQEKLLKSLIPEDAPYKVFRDPEGFLLWEKNALTLVSDRLPAGIAKKFKVSYADLLRTNNIEDPKKLQIGQKLLIP